MKVESYYISSITQLDYQYQVLPCQKEPEVILKSIFKSWIQIHGASEKCLTDNGGEFANSKSIDMAECMKITVKVTAAESPFSTGLVERQNFIIADMIDKVLK